MKQYCIIYHACMHAHLAHLYTYMHSKKKDVYSQSVLLHTPYNSYYVTMFLGGFSSINCIRSSKIIVAFSFLCTLNSSPMNGDHACRTLCIYDDHEQCSLHYAE